MAKEKSKPGKLTENILAKSKEKVVKKSRAASPKKAYIATKKEEYKPHLNNLEMYLRMMGEVFIEQYAKKEKRIQAMGELVFSLVMLEPAAKRPAKKKDKMSENTPPWCNFFNNFPLESE